MSYKWLKQGLVLNEGVSNRRVPLVITSVVRHFYSDMKLSSLSANFLFFFFSKQSHRKLKNTVQKLSVVGHFLSFFAIRKLLVRLFEQLIRPIEMQLY